MTTLGMHTKSEVGELIAAKDFDIGKIQAAADAFLPTWDAKDIDESAQWDADWKAMLRRWDAAKEAADHTLPPGLSTSEEDWNRLLRALRPDPNRLGATDFQVLYTRLVDAQGGTQVDFTGQPQPQVDDKDLVFFKDTTPIANLVEAGVDLGTHGFDTSTKVLIGLALGVVGLALLKR